MPQESPPVNTVLIVDPDPLFGRILRSKIEKMGFIARIVETGTDALELVKTNVFRIIITEIDTPGISGPDLCRHIRALERPYHTCLFVYTARRDNESRNQVLEAGVDDFIQKPFNSLEFQHRMKNAARMLELDDEIHFGGGTDRATGLTNRNAFLRFFRAMLSQCNREKTVGTLLFVEIVNFQSIYHEVSFEAAQRVQFTVAKNLNAALRSSDILARISDGLFCIMLQANSPEQSDSFAKIVLSRMGEMRIDFEHLTLNPDIHLSIIHFPQDKMTADDILDSGVRTSYSGHSFTWSNAIGQ